MKKFVCIIGLIIGQNLSAQIADKVIRNAKIYTSNDDQPFAESIAIKDGKFIYIGNDIDVDQHIDGSTTVEDMGGRVILPGFHDVHMHPLEAGSPNAGGCGLDNQETDPENLGTAIENCALTPNENGWIMASGHSIYTLYDATRDPKDILDDYYPNTPLVVMEETSHSVWLNTKALQELNITATTPDPIGGHIYKNALGEPNGICMDNAGDVALSNALSSTTVIDANNYDGLVNYSLPLLAKNGITSICEGRTYWKRNYHTIWQQIKNDGLLTCRVNLAPWVYPSDVDTTQIPIIQSLYDQGDDLLKISQIKVYADGITINATAALEAPYNDNLGLPFNTGLNYIDEARLTNLITILEQTGFDFHIHAIGDRGVNEAINSIEAARNTNGDLDRRHRITHLEIVTPSDYARLEPLNIIADMQVTGDFTNPGHWHDNDFLIGANRSNNLIPLRSIYDTGAKVTLSSDWDVSSLNPFVGIQNSLTRIPQNLPSIEESIKAYTINGAFVMRQDSVTGSIELGKYADFICINQDVFTIPINQIGSTKVLCTNLAGTEIYRSNLLSTSPVERIHFQISPNPAHDSVIFHIDSDNFETISIYSSNGNLVKQISVIKNESVINIKDLKTGLYFVEIEKSNGRVISSKFLKH